MSHVRALGVLGLVVAVLAACSGDDGRASPGITTEDPGTADLSSDAEVIVPPRGWFEAISPDGDFRILFPAEPLLDTESNALVHDTPTVAFVVSSYDYPGQIDTADSVGLLTNYRDRIIAATEGELEFDELVTLQGRDGIRFLVNHLQDGQPAFFSVLAFIDGEQFYEVIAAGEEDADERINAATFIDSFAFTDDQ